MMTNDDIVEYKTPIKIAYKGAALGIGLRKEVTELLNMNDGDLWNLIIKIDKRTNEKYIEIRKKQNIVHEKPLTSFD